MGQGKHRGGNDNNYRMPKPRPLSGQGWLPPQKTTDNITAEEDFLSECYVQKLIQYPAKQKAFQVFKKAMTQPHLNIEFLRDEKHKTLSFPMR